ncbi:MAG TPA: hypothetical protein VGU03_12195 [Frateuria sp.]|uniref:hypothetical protein n=1 Tax=Frateuria sp. TaxID=2211372 RepID=UPI002DE3FBB0|nr:hypothetical protein [Frateuria sp.]
MTLKTHPSFCLWAIALAALPMVASAWQAKPNQPVPPPRPVVIVQPPANARFQQVMREQQVRDQLQQNQVEEQLRERQMQALRQPYAADPARAARLDQADQAQRELYRVRQQDVLDRYQSTVAPPVVHSASEPATPRSGG